VHTARSPFSTVVVGEVLFGVADVTRHRAMARAMTDGVRALTPSRADWLAAARAIAALGGDKITKSRSFWNDTLIAAQCARLGLVLITNNPADYRRLQAHPTFAAVPPFPS
jgi:predicted nucleic acid-binding protein